MTYGTLSPAMAMAEHKFCLCVKRWCFSKPCLKTTEIWIMRYAMYEITEPLGVL